jgi:hypothetical protein
MEEEGGGSGRVLDRERRWGMMNVADEWVDWYVNAWSSFMRVCISAQQRSSYADCGRYVQI